MSRTLLWMFCLCFAAHTAAADVKVEEQILQKGVYSDAQCKSDVSDPSYDACKCEADVRYPKLGGMLNAEVEQTLNARFKKDAEQAHCPGTQAAGDAKDEKKAPSSATHRYEVTFQSPSALGLEFTDWGYTGGAHGNGSVNGVILDLEKGKILTIADLFAAKDLLAINKIIYETLSAKPEGEVFTEEVESRKGTFITVDGCQGCTLVLGPQGVKVVFQTYEVAPYAAGNIEVAVPQALISYPSLFKYKTSSAGEKK